MKKLISLLVLPALALVLSNCQEREINEPQNNLDYSEYLSLSADHAGDLSIPKEDFESISKAFPRVGIYEKDGVIRLTAKSAKEVNISDELFAFFQNLVDHENERNAELAVSSSIPLLKTRTESGGGGIGDLFRNVDCVARCIDYIHDDVNGENIRIRDVKARLEAKYPDSKKKGIRADKVEEALGLFYGVRSLTLQELYGFSNANGQRVIINTTTHAFVLNSINLSTGEVLGLDPQNNNQPYICHIRDVLQAFLCQK